MGTQERATKKGMNRGSMKAYNFFSDAISSTKSAAESSLEQNVIAAINKVISKNKKWVYQLVHIYMRGWRLPVNSNVL